MNTIKIFLNLENHPLTMIQNGFKKLKRDELLIGINFIIQNDSLNKDDFEYKLNRLFMDKLEKPKNWTNILELLSITNTLRNL
jgi:hypothetical protein